LRLTYRKSVKMLAHAAAQMYDKEQCSLTKTFIKRRNRLPYYSNTIYKAAILKNPLDSEEQTKEYICA
jgi:hypothetical protein